MRTHTTQDRPIFLIVLAALLLLCTTLTLSGCGDEDSPAGDPCELNEAAFCDGDNLFECRRQNDGSSRWEKIDCGWLFGCGCEGYSDVCECVSLST